MLKLGITGGIGSGKSVVCRILGCFGIPVFRADDEGRRLLTGDAETAREVTSLLGSAILTDGRPDPKKIAPLVFADPARLRSLNDIIHPAVRRSFTAWCGNFKKGCVAEEAAILFESGAYQLLDRVIVVTAPQQLRIKRVTERDKLGEEDVKRRMQFQWSDDELVKRADFVIRNDDRTPLIPQVMNILEKLKSECKDINN